MMRPFIVILISFSLTACATHKPSLSAITYNAQDLEVRAPSAAKNSGSQKHYISLDLPYDAFRKILKELEVNEKRTLKNRGEAHVTVVTPPEFRALSKKIPPKVMHAMAESTGLQKSPYKLLCLGKGSLKENGQELTTYFVVVESDALFQFRKSLQALYVQKGGAAADFNAESFYPHVTVGFTSKDLHFEDGVIKDASSCIYSLHAEENKKN